MTIARKQIGPSENYMGHVITIHEMPIDVLLRVDGDDYGMFIDTESARRRGRRTVEALEKEKASTEETTS